MTSGGQRDEEMDGRDTDSRMLSVSRLCFYQRVYNRPVLV